MGDALLDRLDPRHYREVAKLLLSKPVIGWVESGEEAASDNPGAFAKYRLLPRVLRDVSAVSTATTILGTSVKTPIAVAPIGIQKALHPQGEILPVLALDGPRRDQAQPRQRALHQVEHEQPQHRRRIGGAAPPRPAP